MRTLQVKVREEHAMGLKASETVSPKGERGTYPSAMKKAPATATVYLSSEKMTRREGGATCFLRPGSRGFMIKFAISRHPRFRYAAESKACVSEEGGERGTRTDTLEHLPQIGRAHV